MSQSRNVDVDKILADLRALMLGVGDTLSPELKASLHEMVNTLDKTLRDEGNINRKTLISQVESTLGNVGQGNKRVAKALQQLADVVTESNKQLKTPVNDVNAQPDAAPTQSPRVKR
jgi:hypothetical protein